MKTTTVIVLALLSSASHANDAAGTVTVPWGEFESLYKARLEAQIDEQLNRTNQQPLVSIRAADYRLTIGPTSVTGQVRLEGQVLQGQPEPVALFGQDLTVTAIDSISGGALFGDARGYKFQMQADAASFKLNASFALPVQEDQRSRFVAFETPPAVLNSLTVSLDDSLRLVETPGLTQTGSRYHFAAGQAVRIRFDTSASGVDDEPLIDTFTVFEVQGARLLCTSYFVPLRPVAGPLRIQFPVQRYQRSSLKPSWIQPDVQSGDLIVNLPGDWQQPFNLSYEVPLAASISTTLVGISANRGRQGEFMLKQPDDAQLVVTGKNLLDALAASGLSAELREAVGIERAYSRLIGDGSLQMRFSRYDAVEQPQLVLDKIYLHTQFSENGTALTLLRLQLPANAGPSLRIKPVPGADVWLLEVNGKPRQLYTEANGDWVVPLDTGSSVIELSYLRKGSKLGLEGRLEFMVPATGLAARHLNVALALSNRLELVALEGDLEPAGSQGWPSLPEADGKRYYFSYPFYRGDSVSAAIFYQEPIDDGAS